MHAPASARASLNCRRPVEMENHSRRALPPAARNTGDQKDNINPHTQAEARSSWVDLQRLACPRWWTSSIVRDEEQHLLNLARTRDLDSPEGKPTLPWMGRVRSAAAERNGPRGDAQSEDSASAMALQSASQGNPNVDNRTSDRTNYDPTRPNSEKLNSSRNPLL